MTDELIIYKTDDGKADVKLYSKDGVVWMNQQQMALLFDTSRQNISLHILNILQEKELEEKSVVKDYLTTAADGKNYLTEDELDSLNRIVMIFLESAEFRAKMRKDLTMHYWEENVDKLIADHDLPLLQDKGEKSHKQMEKKVEQIYIEFDSRRKHFEAIEADKQDEAELKMLEDAEKNIKRNK